MQTTRGQSVDERKQLWEILNQVQRSRQYSSTELAQLRDQVTRFGSIDSVDKRLRKVEYNLALIDDPVDLLTKMQLSGTTSLLHAQAPSGPSERDHDTA